MVNEEKQGPSFFDRIQQVSTARDSVGLAREILANLPEDTETARRLLGQLFTLLGNHTTDETYRDEVAHLRFQIETTEQRLIRNETILRPDSEGVAEEGVAEENALIVSQGDSAQDRRPPTMALEERPDETEEEYRERVEGEVSKFIQKFRVQLSGLISKISSVEQQADTLSLADLLVEVESLRKLNRETTAFFWSINSKMIALGFDLTEMDKYSRVLEKQSERIAALVNDYEKKADAERKKKQEKDASDAPKVEKESEIEVEVQLFNDLKDRLWAAGSYQITQDKDELTPLLEKLYDHLNSLKRLGLETEKYNELKLTFYKTKFALTKSSVITSLEALEFNDDGHGKVDDFQNLVFNPLIATLREVISLVPEAEKPRFKSDFERWNQIYDDYLTFYMAVKPIKNDALGAVGDTQDKDAYPMKTPATMPVYLNNSKNDLLGRLWKGDYPSVEHEDLNSTELETSRSLGTRYVKVKGYGTVESREVLMDVRAIPEAMRMLDMFFQGIAPEGMDRSMAHSYAEKRRTLYGLGGGQIHQLVLDYREAMAEESYKRDLAYARARNLPLPNRNDKIYTMKISRKEAIRAWNSSIAMYRHITLAPSSFDKGAPAYYMFSPDYALSEAKGSGQLSPLVYLYFFGLSNPENVTEDNPDGIPFFTLDGYVENRLKKHGGHHNADPIHSLMEKAANMVSPKDLRGKIKNALREHGYNPDDYWFLCDAPTNILEPVGKRVTLDSNGKVKKQRFHYLAFTSPLRNMVLRDHQEKPLRTKTTDGEEGAILTFADLVDFRTKSKHNPNGSLLYELMDFEKCDNKEQLKWWVNQIKNAERFYSTVLFAPSEEFASKSTRNLLEGLGKDAKYVTSLLEPYALYLDGRYGDINGNDVIRMLVMSIAHLKAIQAVLDGKSLHQVTHQISQYKLLHCSESDIHALIAAVEAEFTVFSGAKEIVSNLADQVVKSLEYNRH